MEDDKHYPPGAEPEKPAQEPTKPEAPTEERPKPEEAKATPEPKSDAPKPEAEKPKDEAKPQPDPIKKRSIYDDYKEEKHDRKTAEAEREQWKGTAIAALRAQGHEIQGTETVEELQALLQKKQDAKSPAAKAAVDDEITAFAEEEGLKPESLARLTQIILSKVPKAEMPEGLSKEEVDAWRADRATRQREAEDRAIEAQAPAVRTQMKELGFEIHDDAEVTAVMIEIKRLAHTARYHDKEVDYIVFREKEALAKLISPKKPSFEQGGGGLSSDSETEPDLSGGRVTPGMVQAAVSKPSRTSLDIKKSR